MRQTFRNLAVVVDDTAAAAADRFDAAAVDNSQSALESLENSAAVDNSQSALVEHSKASDVASVEEHHTFAGEHG